VPEGFGKLPLFDQRRCETVVGVGITGPQAQRLAQGGGGPCNLAPIQKGPPQVGVGLGVIPCPLDGTPEAPDRLIQSALPGIKAPQAVVDPVQLRLKPQRLLKARLGLLVVSLFRQGRPEVRVRVGVVGLDPERTLELRHRLVELPLPRQRDPQIVDRLRVLRS